MLKKLDFRSAAHLLSKIICLADDFYLYGEQLEKLGFVAFRESLNNFDEFSANQAELDLHRKVTLEKAKESLADPFSSAFELTNRDEYRTPYRSVFLQQRMVEINPEGLSYQDIPYTDEWKMELSPCLRKFKRLDYVQSQQDGALKQSRFQVLREQEINRILGGRIFGSLPYATEDVQKFVQQQMKTVWAKYGFAEDTKISTKSINFFSKPLIGEWIICVALLGDITGNNTRSFDIQADGRKTYSPKSFHFYLDIRPKGRKGLRSRTLTALPINIAIISPLGEYEYSRFFDLDELAVAIYGYAALYGLMQENLESLLIKGIEEL